MATTTPDLVTLRLLKELEYQLGLRGIDVFPPTSHIAQLWRDLKASLPADMQKAERILAQRREIIGNAELEATSMIASARETAVQDAQRETQEIRDLAQRQAEEARRRNAESLARKRQTLKLVQDAVRLCEQLLSRKPAWQKLESQQAALQELLERVPPPAD